MFCYFIGKPWKKLYFWTSPGRRQAEEPPRVAVDVSAQSKGRPWLHLSAPRWWYERSTTDGATGAWVRKVIFELKFHVLWWFLSPLSLRLLLLILSYVLLYVLYFLLYALLYIYNVCVCVCVFLLLVLLGSHVSWPMIQCPDHHLLDEGPIVGIFRKPLYQNIRWTWFLYLLQTFPCTNPLNTNDTWWKT